MDAKLENPDAFLSITYNEIRAAILPLYGNAHRTAMLYVCSFITLESDLKEIWQYDRYADYE